MASNLSFTASFVDATKPTLSITNLAAYCTVTNQLITVNGNASDNLSVANVFYNLNNSGWTAAATGNNWTNWSAALNIMLGTNALSAYAMDAAGNFCATNTVRFTYVLVAPLTVRTNGAGSIRVAFSSPALRERYRNLDTEIDGGTPEQFQALVRPKHRSGRRW